MGLPTLKKTLLASATALALMGWSLDVQALALGAITVRSALGEPLRAEVEIPEMSSEEAATLQANLGSAQAFRSAGVDYSPALVGAQLTLQKRANGQSYLRILGNRPVNDPILGVVIEASWAGGRIVRDYALLLDPPGREALPAVVATAPKTATPPATAAPARPTVAEQTTRSARTAEPRAGVAAAGQVTVKKGETASGIARAHGLDGVSLDQMLIAMLQANPKAFIRGNVNLIRAGAVLQMPSAEQAQATSRSEARRTVVAQTRDFQDYRRALAQTAPARQVSAGSAGRSASGRVQAQVQEQQATPTGGDKVEVSAPGTAATSSESQAATARQQQAESKRTEELRTNIKQLEAAANATGAAAGTQETAPGSAPGINVPAGTPGAAAPTTAAASAAAGSVATASEAGTAAAPSEPASEAAGSAPTTTQQPAETPKPAPAPVTPAPIVGEGGSASFLDDLRENPLLPAGAAALILLLAGYGFYRARQRKKEDVDDGYAEHSLQRDSFGRVSVGPDEDKREAQKSAATSSVGSYSPSQINPDEVDPVAEADVYLAYGRDKQAEDILREALRASPKRIAIHRKLAEIYAKRRDARALEAIANEAHGLAQPKDSDWQAIASLGTELDPENPVYKPGGTPRPKSAAELDEHRFGQDTMPESGHSDLAAAVPSDSLAVPLDLNLDLSDLAGRATNGSGPRSTAPGQAESTLSPTSGAPAMHPAIARSIRERPTEPIVLDNDAVDLDLGLNAEQAAAPAKAAATKPASDKESQPLDMLDFNIGDETDDLVAASVLETHQPPAEEVDDPLSTKLSLAQEFRAIGDREGARALAQEVAAAATGDLKAQAQRLLTEL